MKNSSFFLFITFILFGTFLTSLEAMPTTLLEKKGALSDGKTEQENQEEERIFQNQRERMADLTEEDNSSSTLERGSIIDTKEEDPFSTDEENPSLPAQVPSIAVETKADKKLSIIAGVTAPHEELTVVRDFLDSIPLLPGKKVTLFGQDALKRRVHPKLVAELNSFRNQIQVAFSQNRILSAHYLTGIALKLKKGIEYNCEAIKFKKEAQQIVTTFIPGRSLYDRTLIKANLSRAVAEDALMLAQYSKQELRADNYEALAMRGKAPHLEEGKSAHQWFQEKERYHVAASLIEDHMKKAIQEISKEEPQDFSSFNPMARGIIKRNQEALNAYTQTIHEEKLADDYHAQALAFFPGEKSAFNQKLVLDLSEPFLKEDFFEFNNNKIYQYSDLDEANEAIPDYAILERISVNYRLAAQMKKEDNTCKFWRPVNVYDSTQSNHPDLIMDYIECLKCILEAKQQNRLDKIEKYSKLALKSSTIPSRIKYAPSEWVAAAREEVLAGLADSEWISAGASRDEGESK